MPEKIQINLNPGIPPLPRIADKTKVDLRYALVSPYAFAHIYWDKEISELIYEVEEPVLSPEEEKILEKIREGMREIININVLSEKTVDAMIEYLDKTARLLISELNFKVNEGTYKKIFYYLFRDFIGLNEIEPLTRDYFIEDIECNGVNTPLYIIHRIYRNIKTNIVYKNVDNLASFVEKLAQRCGKYISYASPLLDGSLPDGSIDYEEPVIYKENGIIKVSRIGEFIDKFYKDGEADKPVNVDNIEVPAFDKELKIKWRKADYVYRHKINKEIYELKTEFGKKIKLTGCHSIFILGKNGLKAERTDKLKVGDYAAIPLSIPESDAVKEINLAEELSKTSHASKFVLANIPKHLYKDKKEELYNFLRQNYEKPNQAYYEHKKKKILPLKLYYLLKRNELEEARIGTTSEILIKPILKVDKHLMRFLGLYIAEGWLNETENHYRIYFCLNEKEGDLISELKEAAKECFGVDIYIEPPKKNAVKLVINSYVLFTILNEILKVSRGAKEKRVPEIAFNVNKELQQEFLRAWNDGDCGSTASKNLMNDISYLSLFSKDTVAFQKRERASNIEGRDIKSTEYYTNFFKRSVLNEYPKMIPVEVFNPLKETHMKLRNKRINRERLCKILKDIRYQRMRNINAVNSAKFIKEWSERGYIENRKLSEKGRELLEEIEIVNKLVNSDIGFAKIISLNKIKPVKEYVYDFSVKDNENFVGGIGGLCCHNSRVNATYTADVTSRGPTFTIRKFTKVPWTPVQLIALNTLSPEMLAYFWILIQYKCNILITGGTASGKTTLLNALAFFIPPEARVVSIEDTREINIPRENWLPAVARTAIGMGKVGEVDLFSLLKNSFRQNPDYVIVGEVRGKEAFVLFQGMASGHSSISTMHADSVDTVIKRLETPPIELSPTLVNTLDAVAIMTHAIVKKEQTRRLREIVEIVKVDPDGIALTNTPFTWNPSDDRFYFKKDSKVLEKIALRYGLTRQELDREFEMRVKLLIQLYRQKIFGFEEAQKIINEYYKNPVALLKQYGIA